MEDFIIRLQSAILDQKLKQSISDQLLDIQNLAVKVSNVTFDKSALSKVQQTLKNNNVNLNIDVNGTQAIQHSQQVAQAVQANIGKTVRALTELDKLATKGVTIGAVKVDGAVDAVQTLEKVKRIYSEFGRVKITNQVYDDAGTLKNFVVDIQQVNGELKQTRKMFAELTEDGNHIVFPDGMIKGSENYIHHLQDMKNLYNESGNALEKKKQDLKDQRKYYDNINIALRERLRLEKNIKNAGAQEQSEMRKQIKRYREQERYNRQQIDIRGLKDETRERRLKSIEYKGTAQSAVAQAKRKDLEVQSKLVAEQKFYYDDLNNKTVQLFQVKRNILQADETEKGVLVSQLQLLEELIQKDKQYIAQHKLFNPQKDAKQQATEEKYAQQLAVKSAQQADNKRLAEQQKADAKKRSEQKKYYDQLEKNLKEQARLERQIQTAGDGEKSELRKQLKNTDSRLRYNRKQIDERGLKDSDRERTLQEMTTSIGNRSAIQKAKLNDAQAESKLIAEQNVHYQDMESKTSQLFSMKQRMLKADENESRILSEQVKLLEDAIQKEKEYIAQNGLTDRTRDDKQKANEAQYRQQLDIKAAKEADILEQNQAKAEQRRRSEEEKASQRQFAQEQSRARAFEKMLFAQEQRDLKAQTNLQGKIDTNEYEATYRKLIGLSSQWTDELGASRIATNELNNAWNKFQNASGTDKLKFAEEFEHQAQKFHNSIKKYEAEFATNKTTQRTNQRLQEFFDKNTASHSMYGDKLRAMIQETSSGAVVTKKRIDQINNSLATMKNELRQSGKLGKSLFDEISSSASKFTKWVSITSIIMEGMHKVGMAMDELREVNTIITEISKSADGLSQIDLSNIASDAFESASEYGKKASDYLLGVQEMYRAGYTNATELAELSTLAQSAGDLQADLANDYLIATDAAWKLRGNTEALNGVLDGQNYITNKNALSMEDLANATKIAGSQAASAGFSAAEASAMMGTMMATTRQGGEIAARAFRGILMNIQQVKGEVADGELIDETDLSKYEKASLAIGVPLKEIKNGLLALRDPIQVLHELSEAYTALDHDDVRRANLINAVGGKYRGNQFNALLENWDVYEKMLEDYSKGSGSAMEEAMKSANNWQGSLNRLSNTWTDVVGNFVNSEFVVSSLNNLNTALTAINKTTSALGSSGSFGMLAGLVAGFKNVGRTRMFVLLQICRQ